MKLRRIRKVSQRRMHGREWRTWKTRNRICIRWHGVDEFKGMFGNVPPRDQAIESALLNVALRGLGVLHVEAACRPPT